MVGTAVGIADEAFPSRSEVDVDGAAKDRRSADPLHFGIRVETWDAADQPIEPDELWLKRPFKTQVGVPDNRLQPDECRVIRRPLAAGAAFVRVTLLFKPSPLMMERGWTKLGVWEAKVPESK